MLQDRPTVEQIAANEVRIFRGLFILLASVVLLVTLMALLMLAARINLIPQWVFNSLGTALFLGWLAYMLILNKPALPIIDPLDEDYLRQTIDIQQRRDRYLFLCLLINLFSVTSVLTSILVKGQGGPLPALLAGAFAFNVLIMILNLSFGPGIFAHYRRVLTDELSRAQRARAAQCGYIFSVMEMCAVLVAALYHPHWGLVSLPLAIASAIALPAIYFLYLEWRSERG